MIKIESSNKEIITSQDIQNAYLKFYPFMMQYLWDIKTVMNLANLEIAIYKIFPDKDEMERYLNLLEIDIRDTYRDDTGEDAECKEFQAAFDHLRSYIEDYDNSGYDIYRIQETLDADDIIEANEEAEHKEKKVLHVGRIGTKE